jgi:hypothetical protein
MKQKRLRRRGRGGRLEEEKTERKIRKNNVEVKKITNAF